MGLSFTAFHFNYKELEVKQKTKPSFLVGRLDLE